MKIQKQNTPEQIKLGELVEDMSVAMLTTFNDAGLLDSRPMAPLEMDSEGAVWFFTEHDSSKTSYLSTANLAFSDASNSTYVSLAGRGESIKTKKTSTVCGPCLPNLGFLTVPIHPT